MRPRSLALAICAALFLVLPGAATADESSAIPEGATALPGGGYSLELSAPVPDWYTAQLHQQVLAAGSDGVALPDEAKAELPASALAWTGIRPGSWMFFPSWCTMNFVFHSPGSSSWYIGTAGHCAAVGDE